MILGREVLVGGFMGEVIGGNCGERKKYEMEKEIE